MTSDIRVIGFTGTRNGMSQPQLVVVAQLLRDRAALDGPLLHGLHGDCVGADADFDGLCRAIPITVRCRPCTYASMRARTGAIEIAEPKPPMERNRAIVADAAWMIACPPTKERIKSGSGTWATIGFARRANKPLTIVFPDGTLGVSGG